MFQKRKSKLTSQLPQSNFSPTEKLEYIRDFRAKYWFLSNFYPCNIEYQAIQYKCVEAAFQASKSENMLMRAKFSTLNGAKAKSLGRKVDLRNDWDSVKQEIMLELLFLKFGNNGDLLRQLLDTGKSQLVEDNNWHDNFWGNCICDSRNECRQNPGLNLLGKSLMVVREVYQQHYYHILNTA